MKKIFADRQYCFDEILRIRRVMSNDNHHLRDIEAIMTTLIYMRLYCPRDIVMQVDAQIKEVEMRNEM